MKQTTSKAALTEADRCFASVVAAFANRDDVTRGRMMSSYGLKVNEKIFAMCGRGKFVAKLPKARVDEIVRRGEGEHFEPRHGRLMKEWIAIEPGNANWVELANEAYEFVKDASSDVARVGSVRRLGASSSIPAGRHITRRRKPDSMGRS